MVMDSTGLKVYGAGEQKVRKRGYTKRRTWRKSHPGVDESTGDGAYDKSKYWDMLHQ